MDWRCLSCHKEYFVEGLRALCAADAPGGKIWYTNQGGMPKAQRRPSFRCDASPRLHVMLEGRHRLGGSFGGSYREVDLEAGDVFFLPPLTLAQELWSKPCLYLGIVFRPTLVRYLVVDYTGGPAPVGNTPWAFHVNRPLTGPAEQLLNALCGVSTAGQADPLVVRHLVAALLRLALEHLEIEKTLAQPATKSYYTWQLAMEFLLGHYDQPIRREDVAAAVGVHPNYLSALCQQHTRQSFHELLEATRLDRAKTILEQTDWKLEQVSRHCGYGSAAYFVRVFKQATRQTPGEYRRERPRRR